MLILLSLVSFLLCICAGLSVTTYLMGTFKYPNLSPTTTFLVYFLWPMLPLILGVTYLLCLICNKGAKARKGLILTLVFLLNKLVE